MSTPTWLIYGEQQTMLSGCGILIKFDTHKHSINWSERNDWKFGSKTCYITYYVKIYLHSTFDDNTKSAEQKVNVYKNITVYVELCCLWKITACTNVAMISWFKGSYPYLDTFQKSMVV